MAQDYAVSFYKSVEWEKCRSAFMKSKNYICERCGRLAKICHHKTYITPQNINDPDITLSWDNLESLCQDCHTREHLSGEVCAEGLAFDSYGDLIHTPRVTKIDASPRTERPPF